MKNYLVCLLLISVRLFAQNGVHPELEPKFQGKGSEGSVEKNLFLNAKVSASDFIKGFEPQLAVDGVAKDATKHWCSENLPVWLTIELAKSEILEAIRFVPYWLDGRIYKYKIEGSEDGQNWITLVDASGNSISSSENGFIHAFNPQKIKFVKTTILDNTRGKKNGGHIVEIEGFAKIPSAKIIGFAGTTDLRYSRECAVPENKSNSVNLTTWRGEKANAQFVVKVPNGVKNLRIFSGKGSNNIKFNPSFIRFVNSNRGQFADILEDLTEINVLAGESRSIWVNIEIGEKAKIGKSTYTFKVGESLENSVEFKINLDVLSYVLPDPKNWKVHLDLWQTPESLAQFHQVALWSDEHFAIMKPHYKRLADAGQKYITATITHEPWDMQSYAYLPGMIKWTKKANGKMEYDWAVFDKWVNFMRNDIGIKSYISCYTMVPWSLKFRYYDEEKGCNVDFRLEPKSKEYEELWGDFLTKFSKHLKEKGWLKFTRIGIDERPDHWVLPAIEIVKKYAPEIKVISANNHVTEKTMDIVDISPGISVIDHCWNNIKKRKEAGLISTFYVCTNPIRPNTFTFSIPAESEWLLIYAAANNLDGFLRWAFDNFVENPLVNTDYPGKTWPTGDCFMVYPGNRSSIRWEKFRDGIEVFEKINLLREVARKSKQENVIAPLNNYLAETYTWTRGQKANNPYADDNAKTSELINVAAEKLLK